MICDANWWRNFVYSPPPFGLDRFYFLIKLVFYISLKLRENRENARFASNRIKPNKFAKMVNKNNIKVCTIIR
jgi:hypothetical protein